MLRHFTGNNLGARLDFFPSHLKNNIVLNITNTRGNEKLNQVRLHKAQIKKLIIALGKLINATN